MNALLLLGTPFGQLSQSATRVDNLGRYLDAYVGDCQGNSDPEFDSAACHKKAAGVRSQEKGRRLWVEVDDLEGLIQYRGLDKRKSAYRFDLTPIFAPRSVAMSIGVPKRLDSDGQPRIRQRVLYVPQTSALPERLMRSMVRRGGFRLELVVEVKRGWQLKRGRHQALGMATELLALRLSDNRGDVLLEESYR